MVTILACALKFCSFSDVFAFLKMVSSLDRFRFSSLISGVMKGLCGRDKQEVVFKGVWLSKRVVRVEVNC